MHLQSKLYDLFEQRLVSLCCRVLEWCGRVRVQAPDWTNTLKITEDVLCLCFDISKWLDILVSWDKDDKW